MQSQQKTMRFKDIGLLEFTSQLLTVDLFKREDSLH